MNDSNSITLRRIVPDDADAVHRLRLRALREHPAAFLSDLQDEAARTVADVASRIGASTDTISQGAFAGMELVGIGTFVRERRTKQRHRAAIVGMHVASEWQGRGVGGAVLDALIEHARAQPGLTQLVLGVIAGNSSARRLYRSRGFESYGVDRGALVHDGRAYDDELMALDLAHPSAAGGTARLAGFIIDCQGSDLDAAAAFWAAALDMAEHALPGTEGQRYRQLVDPRRRLHVEVQMVQYASGVHLDIEADHIEHAARRLEALGATRVAFVQDWLVMQAPTGQRFCIVPRRQSGTPAG